MLIDNLAQFLIDNGAVTAEGTDLFIGQFPDTEGTTYDNIVLLRDTGGLEPNKYVDIKQVTIQVTVRNTAYDTGYAKIDTIRDLLHRKLDNTTLESGGADTMTIFSMQEPTHLGLDENNRHLFVCNFVFKVRE